MTGKRQLPSGLVTFAFTDVVGSTRAFVEHGAAFVEALAAVHERTAAHVERAGGVVVSTEGDGAFLAFPHAPPAVEALIALQEDLATSPTAPLPLLLRAGAHTGEATPVGDNYVALSVHVAARVAGTANAGQLFVTDAVIEALDDGGWAHTGRAREVGTYALKDLAEPARLWRLAGGPEPPRATPARRTNVRQSRTSFIGRGEDLHELRSLVHGAGLVTCVGPGGVGKTRIVSELALADAESFPAGSWLVELASIDGADRLVDTVGAALGLSTKDPADLEAALLRRGRCLLVLDNCEHLVDAVAELVDRLVTSCPELSVLCTSRESLRVPGERVWPLSRLADAGVALFLDRADLPPDREPPAERVGQLCEALDGLPLAIELAAGHARSTTFEELLAAVSSGSDSLERRGGPARQRSLDGVLEWSLTHLPERLRDSLLVLAVFPGRFTASMAGAVLEAAPRCDPSATRELCARSLVDLDGEDYRLLSTVRAAAQRHAAQDPSWREESLDALVGWAAAYGAERYEVRDYQEAVPRDTLLAVEAALAHAAGRPPQGLGRAWDLMAVTSGVRGPSTVLVAAAERVVSSFDDLRDPDSALAVAGAANVLYASGGPTMSADRAERVTAAARASGDARVLERALSAAAFGHRVAGDVEAALAGREEILALAQARPELGHQLPSALNNLSVSLLDAGRVPEAEDAMRQAVVAAQRAGFGVSEAIAHFNLAESGLENGRPRQAAEHSLRALGVAPPDWRTRGLTLSLLAQAHLRLGDRESALAAGREALTLLRARVDVEASIPRDVAELLEVLPELAT